MKAEYVNAFLVPSVMVLKQMGNIEVTLGKVSRLKESQLGDNVSIIIGLQGRLSGSVVLTAPREVAWRVAGRIGKQEFGIDDRADVREILAELANTIVGNATGHLYQIGVREGITPPTVVEGPGISVSFGQDVESVLVPLGTDDGELQMIVSLKKG